MIEEPITSIPMRVDRIASTTLYTMVEKLIMMPMRIRPAMANMYQLIPVSCSNACAPSATWPGQM